ncbi:MAG: hypothetical protein ACOC6L_00870, partial [Thermodesulfobacteriota bacterium]
TKKATKVPFPKEGGKPSWPKYSSNFLKWLACCGASYPLLMAQIYHRYKKFKKKISAYPQVIL